MSGRLIIAIVSTIAEETAIMLLSLWLLPRIKVHIPVFLLAIIMLAWLGWSVFTYRKGTTALVRNPVRGLVDMKGMKGVVVQPLRPEGLIKIGGELWNARAISGRTESGTNVVVVSQQGLKLIVRVEDSGSAAPPVDRLRR
jgi:membrane protein implicated in regulation of membrane protease activity